MTREQEIKNWIRIHGRAKVWAALTEVLKQTKVLSHK